MNRISPTLGLVLVFLLVAGCSGKEPPSTTKGKLTVECDESVWPVMKMQADDFKSTYPETDVAVKAVDAREAIANFVTDSVRVIVSARAFNAEEKAVIAKEEIELREYKVALDAIAVIVNKENPVKEMRIGQLDSIFSGYTYRWPAKGTGDVIDVAVGGFNASTNEVFRNVVMNGKGFSASATPYDSSSRLIEHVRSHRNAIGIVGLNWLGGIETDVTVLALRGANAPPDTTEPAGKYYLPYQAYLYKGYYPLTRSVFMYSREVLPNVSLGFISYVASAKGQQLFLNNGLVPVTMPVRIVELTSKQVKPR